ncbi:MAG: hypothetical protein ACOX4P_07970 [Anaerovoracaceae bacterium]|jgi:hypothetical protein
MNNQKLSTISISEDLVNRDLRQLILSYVGSYITDYTVYFSGNFIFLDLKLQIKTLGPISARYKLNIINFTFNQQAHIIEFAYEEDVQSTSNPLQGMLVKAMGLTQGTFLQKAIALTNPPGIRADSKNCSIDLEQFLNLNQGHVSKLSLNYLDSYNRTLQFAFRIQP